MNIFERSCISLRHVPCLDGADWLWDAVRPAYNTLTTMYGRRGLERVINGADRVRLLPRFRGVPETYEPNFWKCLMAEAQPGDMVADVGAHIGLYTVALAKRVGSAGKVHAFEPNPASFDALRAHVALNGVSDRVQLTEAAVAEQVGEVGFQPNRECQSHIDVDGSVGKHRVRCLTLDSVFGAMSLSILKIDVEGYEEHVLRGAATLVGSPARSPRAIFLEVHPHCWQRYGVTSRSLLDTLRHFGYHVFGLHGDPIHEIREYGSIVARRVSHG